MSAESARAKAATHHDLRAKAQNPQAPTDPAEGGRKRTRTGLHFQDSRGGEHAAADRLKQPHYGTPDWSQVRGAAETAVRKVQMTEAQTAKLVPIANSLESCYKDPEQQSTPEPKA